MTDKSKYRPKTLPMDEIIDRYVNGMEFITTLAKEYDVTYTTMKNRLVKSGVQIRNKKEEKKRVMNQEETKKRVSEGSKRSAEQRKKTNLERYGHETAMDAPQIKEKWQKEHEEKHGVKWGTQRKDTVEKRKQTLLKEHGVDNVAKIPEVAEKISQNRWQNKSEEELIEIIEKMQDLSPESKKRHSEGIKKNRWENKSEEELKEIWNKTVNTWVNNFGYDNPNKRPEAKERLRKEKQELFINYRLQYVLDYLNVELLNEWNGARSRYDFKCKKCNTIFNRDYVDVYIGRSQCPTCNSDSSKGENEIYSFLRNELNIENIIVKTRKIIKSTDNGNGYELDFYLPDYNFAIEFDGLWWHREERFGKNYHLIKTKLCDEKGIKLIHIFEDEWAFKRDIVKEKIKHILNLNGNKERINARDCIIKEIDSKLKTEFLEKFHLQESMADMSGIRLGAFKNNELIAVMTFSKGNIFKGNISYKEGEYELNRFCVNYNYQIPGIGSKLLEYFKNNYNWNKIYTYADKRWSTGDLYYKLGFKYLYDTDPSERYIYGLRRIHYIQLREMSNPEKFHKIWDCGHMKFELENT